MRRVLVSTFAVVAALLVFPAAAATKGFIDAKKVKPEQIGQVAEIVESEMAPGGRFGDVSAAERAQVSALLVEMQQIVAGKQTLKDLNEDERVALINAQERANAILAKRDGERLICKRRQLVGTHRSETFCERADDKKRRNRYSNDVAREYDRRARVCTDTFSACKGAAAGGQ